MKGESTGIIVKGKLSWKEREHKNKEEVGSKEKTKGRKDGRKREHGKEKK